MKERVPTFGPLYPGTVPHFQSFDGLKVFVSLSFIQEGILTLSGLDFLPA